MRVYDGAKETIQLKFFWFIRQEAQTDIRKISSVDPSTPWS